MREIRRATEADWPAIERLLAEVYRADHPCRNWAWYAAYRLRHTVLVATVDEVIVGHVAAHRTPYHRDPVRPNGPRDVHWMTDLVVAKAHRGWGFGEALVLELCGRHPGQVCGTNASPAGDALFRRLGWTRYADLVRWVWTAGPAVMADAALAPLPPRESVGHRNWLEARHIGGARVLEIRDPQSTTEGLARDGYRWADYITSWNNPLSGLLARAGWVTDSPIPWLLDPVVPGSQCRVTHYAAPGAPYVVVYPLDSDHLRPGRVRS